MSELTEKLIRGSLFRILNIISIVFISFFMMPFVIRVLGDRWYGLWIFAASIVGYYGFLDLGLSSAVQRFVSRAMGLGDRDEINRVFSTSLFLFFMAGIVVFLISLVIVMICPHFVHDPKSINTFRIVIFVIGLDVAIAFPVRAFTGFLCSHVRHDVVNLLDISKLILRTLLIVFFLKRGHGIIALAVINLAVDVAQQIATVIFVMARFRTLELRFSYICKERMRKLLGYSIFSFITQLSDMVRFQTDNFVISAFLGLNFVTHYSIGARISIYYQKFAQSGVAHIFPVFSKLEGQKDFDQIRDKYLLMLKFTTIFSVFVGGAAIIFGKAFISRWMGVSYLDAYTILAILIVGMLFNCTQTVSMMVLFSLNKHKQYSIIVSSEAVANLALSLLLVRRYGITGVAVGTTLPMLITSIFITPVYTCKVIEVRLFRYVKMLVVSLFFGVAIYFGAWRIVHNMIEPSYLSIVKLGLPVAVVFLGLNAFVLLNRNQRSYFKIPF